MATPARRTPFTSMAGQLYPEDDQQDFETAGPEEDAAGVPDEPDTSPAQPMTQEEMADKVYPAEAEGKDSKQNPPDNQDAEDVDEGPGEEEQEGAQPAQGEHGPAAQAGADKVHAVLGAFGIKNEPGSKEAEAMAKLDAGVRKAIADAEASKGAPLTAEEEQNISSEYIANHAMKWLRVGKHDPDKLVKDMWDGVDNPDDIAHCARRFREAFEISGGNAQVVGGKNPPAGKDWGPTLEKNGYEKVSTENYTPQNGDVRVISGVPPRDPQHPTPPEKYGHVQVYDGEHKQWVSERKEGPDGISSVFKRGHATIAVYRFNPF